MLMGQNSMDNNEDTDSLSMIFEFLKIYHCEIV